MKKRSTLTITSISRSQEDLPCLAEMPFATFCLYREKLVLVSTAGVVEMDSGAFISDEEVCWSDKCVPLESHLSYRVVQ